MVYEFVVVLLHADHTLQQIFGPYTGLNAAEDALRDLAGWPGLHGQWEVRRLTPHTANPPRRAEPHQAPPAFPATGPAPIWPTTPRPSYPFPGPAPYTTPLWLGPAPVTCCPTSYTFTWLPTDPPDIEPDDGVPAHV